MTNNQIDIGVRVELPALIFEHITDVVYESKLIYRTKQYGDQVRTFCMNPYGHVVAENVEGIHTVNGHSYSDPKLRSENTNFALLVSNHFTEPFDEPYRYGKHIASLSNMLAGGVLVQRFGDLVRGVRSNAHRMGKSTTHPTLTAAVPGDLSLALPKRQLDDIIEMIYALDKLAPGTANYDTLLYGAEVKFYSARLKLSTHLETSLPNFFAAGDGAGITRGLAQAGGLRGPGGPGHHPTDSGRVRRSLRRFSTGRARSFRPPVYFPQDRRHSGILLLLFVIELLIFRHFYKEFFPLCVLTNQISSNFA